MSWTDVPGLPALDQLVTLKQCIVLCLCASFVSCVVTCYFGVRRLSWYLSRTAHSYVSI